MVQPEVSDNAPAAVLFPQFEAEVYRMISAEVRGLTEEQLDYESDRWEWSKWSIRRNLSHMASGDIRWFWGRWGPILFPEGLPSGDEFDTLMGSPHDRRLDENMYWEVDDILEKLQMGLELSCSILGSETVGSLRAKELEIENAGLSVQHPELFSGGIREVPGNSSRIYMTLEATFRHRYYEYLTHLYNIQRLKRAQGLNTKVDIPLEGYWALPDWDRSEP